MTYQIALVSIAASLTALAQVSATVVPGSSGRSRIVVTNQSDIPLEAYEVTWVAPRGPHFSNTATSVSYVDNAFQMSAKPAERASISIGGDADTTVQVRAAIFKDGSTFGDSEWVAILMKRREQYDASLDAFLRELRAAANESLTREELVTRLEALRISLLATLPAATATITELNLPSLTAAAQREAVEMVSGLVIASFKKLPVIRRGASVKTQSYRETLASTTQMLKDRRITFSSVMGN